MPELYVYAIVVLAVFVTIGFVLVMRDDKEVKRIVASKAVTRQPAPAPAVARPAEAAPPAAPALLSSREALQSPAPPPPAESGPVLAPSRRRRRPAEMERLPPETQEEPVRALVTHLSREVDTLRAEREAAKEEVRRLREALADATLTIRSLEAKLAGAEMHGNVYSLPSKRAG